jgi:Protein of unknown function (DUF1759)
MAGLANEPRFQAREHQYGPQLLSAQPQLSTTEVLLHALAKKTLEREQALQNPTQWYRSSGVGIPEITQKSFSGDITKYREFKEHFNSLMLHSQTSIMDHFNLLKSKVNGKAAEAIQTLHMTEGNYPIAWATLDRTFDNARHLAKLELEAMLALPHRPTIAGNSDSIISYINYSKGRIANLKRNKVTGDEILSYLVIRGMDPYTRGRMEDYVD